MKKSFKVGDKVFAKVKGYPPWPAQIIGENGKKYNVEFYGTGETGIIKVEDLFYYLKNKEKFQKPLKRKDYVDAFEQIEKAIKEVGGDGDNSTENDESVANESSASVTSDTSSLTPIPKALPNKTVKRKRSASEKSKTDAQSPSKKNTSENSGRAEDVLIESTKTPIKKTSTVKENKFKESPSNTQKSNEFEFVPINDSIKNLPEEDGENTDGQNENEKSEALDFKVEIVSEKILKNNITYANYVKEKESIYKGRPVEPREDYISQVLPVKLPSGIMGGIKLHTKWPLKYENEYARAVYDESVAQRVLEEKKKIVSGNTGIINNPQLFIGNIEMSADDVVESLYLKDINAKKARIERLKIEADLMALDSKIKNCLGLDKADPKQAVQYLEAMCDIDFDDLMLKKHPHVIEMVRRLRKYVGNTKEWNLSDASLIEFYAQAEEVREKADTVYEKFKKVVKVSDDATSFWDGFSDVVVEFRQQCIEMTDAQVYLLCTEPGSRRAFFDHLDEIESEKENTSGIANAELENIINGGLETPAQS